MIRTDLSGFLRPGARVLLTCPRCGGTRRVVAVVLRSSTAQAILEHLRLPSRPLPLAPATSPPQLGFW